MKIKNGQNPGSRILVVDDDTDFREMVMWYLRKRGFVVEIAQDGKEAMGRVIDGKYDIVITDLTMPEMDGLALLDEVKTKAPQTAVIIITGFGTVGTAVHAMKQGAFDFVLKPFNMGHLEQLIHQIL